MLKKINFYSISLVIILVLAAFLRLWQLSSLPIGLFGDEVDVGYHAWSIITTGKDYYGQFMPSYIHSLAEWRAPLLMYVTAPFVGVLGPSAFSVRLPVALVGILGVYLIYLLVTKLTRSKKSGLFAGLLLAISPWHLHYSRAAFESTLLLDLLLLGVYLFVNNKEILSLIPFALTFYTYSTANLITPLLLFGLFFIYKPKIKISSQIPQLALSILIILPIAYQILFGQAAGRFKGISIFGDQKLIDSVIVARTEPWAIGSKSDIFFTNKYAAFLNTFLTQYFSAFNPSFLFFQGDPYFRHSIGGFGEFLWPTIVFFFLGLAYAVKKTSSSHRLMFYWLLISPLASALTQSGANHATRLFVMIPPVIYFSSLGLEFVMEYLKPKYLKNIFLIIFALLFVYNLFAYWNQYSLHYRYQSAKFWNDGYQEIFTKLSPYLATSSKVYINNTYEPSLIRYAFFTKLNPANFIKQFTTDNPDSFKSENFNGFQFGNKTYFGTVPSLANLQALLKPGGIYLAVQGKEVVGDWDWTKNPPAGIKVLDFVKDVYGKPLFYLLTK